MLFVNKQGTRPQLQHQQLSVKNAIHFFQEFKVVKLEKALQVLSVIYLFKIASAKKPLSTGKGWIRAKWPAETQFSLISRWGHFCYYFTLRTNLLLLSLMKLEINSVVLWPLTIPMGQHQRELYICMYWNGQSFRYHVTACFNFCLLGMYGYRGCRGGDTAPRGRQLVTCGEFSEFSYLLPLLRTPISHLSNSTLNLLW